MDRSTTGLRTGLIAVGGGLLFAGLTVWPFEYGPVESLIITGGLVGVLLFQTVLDDTSF